MSNRTAFRSSVPAEIRLTEGFALAEAARGGRIPFDRDPFLAAVVAGALDRPSVYPPEVPGASWEPVRADAEGWFNHPAFRRGGYLFVTHTAEAAGVAILAATGHSLVYVNGEPRTGDPYGYDGFQWPVRLNRGVNVFVFSCGRGRCRARLLPNPDGPKFHPDGTVPDIVLGDRGAVWAGIGILNPEEADATDLVLEARSGGKSLQTRIAVVPAVGGRKVGFQLPVPPPPASGNGHLYELFLRRGRTVLDTFKLQVRVRKPEESAKRTFVSQIDGSVQYYGVRPALKPSKGNALVLTLHGASVEGIGQIDAYGSKDWATLVGPTNRRPYGFDWEDWGRLDALEVLADARRRYPHDPARTQITGHSMGGHGTWAIGSLYPDRFAAVGPSAGWISFATYAGGRSARPEPGDDPVAALVRRASLDHDTLQRAPNLLRQQVYILHGDADDNVPVTEARRMREELTALKHPSLGYHEQPGAGHWWGGECVDWKPLFDLFATARLTPNPAEVSFVTTNPAVSARCGWATIVQQEKAMLRSRIDGRVDPASGELTLTTENVALLRLEPSAMPPDTTVRKVVVDGQNVVFVGGGVLHLKRIGGAWRQSPGPRLGDKRPERGGPFKQAYQNRFVLVTGTSGSREETDAMRAKARYDAETFQYRGNGSVDIVADTDFDLRAFRDRGVILYGNADTNRAFGALLSNSPIEVRRDRIRVGRQVRSGDDLLCVFLRPRPDSPVAHVGVVGWTGPRARRVAERLPVFTSGVAYPDWVVASAKTSEQGIGGVIGAGYFGNDWGLESGESAWR